MPQALTFYVAGCVALGKGQAAHEDVTKVTELMFIGLQDRSAAA
jgi:hypothetical protein